MKHKIIGVTALVLSVSIVLGVGNILLKKDSKRYIQHLEDNGYVECENCPDSQLCTHLRL